MLMLENSKSIKTQKYEYLQKINISLTNQNKSISYYYCCGENSTHQVIIWTSP